MAGNLVLLVLLRLLDVGGARGVAPRATARAGGAARALPRLRSLRSLRSGLWSGQPAHEVVEGVGDEDVAPRLIDRQAVGLVQLRAPSRLAVAAERAVHAERAVAGGRRRARARAAVAGDRRDRANRRQLADLVVGAVGDVDVAHAVERHPLWLVELGCRRRRPVAARGRARARARVAVAGDRRD